MSVHPRAAYLYKPTLQPSTLSLAAHTANATALTEALFQGGISQDDYDTRIVATCIMSMTRLMHVPIIMTTDDTLATILALAVRGLDDPSRPIDRDSAKLYLACPKRIFEAIGIPAPVSSELVPLDQDELKKLLTFLKGRHRSVDELVIACEDDVTRSEGLQKYWSRVKDQEDDARGTRNWQATASSGGGREREVGPGVGSIAQHLGQARHRNAALLSPREFLDANEKRGHDLGWRP